MYSATLYAYRGQVELILAEFELSEACSAFQPLFSPWGISETTSDRDILHTEYACKTWICCLLTGCQSTAAAHFHTVVFLHEFEFGAKNSRKLGAHISFERCTPWLRTISTRLTIQYRCDHHIGGTQGTCRSCTLASLGYASVACATMTHWPA